MDKKKRVRWSEQERTLLKSFSHLGDRIGTEAYLEEAKARGLPKRGYWAVRSMRVRNGWLSKKSRWTKLEKQLIYDLAEKYPLSIVPDKYIEEIKGKDEYPERSRNNVRQYIYRLFPDRKFSSLEHLAAREIAQLLNLAPDTVVSWVEKKQLRAFKLGKHKPLITKLIYLVTFAKKYPERFTKASEEALLYLFEDYPSLLKKILECKSKGILPQYRRIREVATGTIFESIAATARANFCDPTTIRYWMKKGERWEYAD